MHARLPLELVQQRILLLCPCWRGLRSNNGLARLRKDGPLMGAPAGLPGRDLLRRRRKDAAIRASPSRVRLGSRWTAARPIRQTSFGWPALDRRLGVRSRAVCADCPIGRIICGKRRENLRAAREQLGTARLERTPLRTWRRRARTAPRARQGRPRWLHRQRRQCSWRSAARAPRRCLASRELPSRRTLDGERGGLGRPGRVLTHRVGRCLSQRRQARRREFGAGGSICVPDPARRCARQHTKGRGAGPAPGRAAWTRRGGGR